MRSPMQSPLATIAVRRLSRRPKQEGANLGENDGQSLVCQDACMYRLPAMGKSMRQIGLPSVQHPQLI